MHCGDCGGQAVVRQASKRGRHFYLTCACGTDMRAGADRQTKIWREAEFNAPEGVTIYKPSNVTDDSGAPPAKTAAAQAEGDAVADEKGPPVKRWRPGDDEAPESGGDAVDSGSDAGGDADGEASSGGNRGALLAVAVALAAAVGGLWMN